LLKNKYIKLAVIAGLVVLCDQITKAIILDRFTLYQSMVVLPGIFNLTYTLNPGGAFGFLAGYSPVWRHALFIVAASLATGLVLYFYINTPKSKPLLAFGLALIFGGAIGNLIDRVRLGKVIDFLDFYIKDMHWPVFNIADSAVSIGVVIFIYHLIIKEKGSGDNDSEDA